MKIFTLFLAFLVFAVVATFANSTVTSSTISSSTSTSTYETEVVTVSVTATAVVEPNVTVAETAVEETVVDEEESVFDYTLTGEKVRMFYVILLYLIVIFDQSFLKSAMFNKIVEKYVIGFFRTASGNGNGNGKRYPSEKIANWTIFFFTISRFMIFFAIFFASYLLIAVIYNASLIWTGIIFGIISLWFLLQTAAIQCTNFTSLKRISEDAINEDSILIFRFLEGITIVMIIIAFVIALIIWKVYEFVIFSNTAIAFSILFFIMLILFFVFEQISLAQVIGVKYFKIPQSVQKGYMGASGYMRKVTKKEK